MGVVGVTMGGGGGGGLLWCLLEGLMVKLTVLWAQQRCILTIGRGLKLERRVRRHAC